VFLFRAKMFKFVVLVGLFTASYALQCGDIQLQKVGCFTKDSTVFPEMLSTNRDSSSRYFTGDKLNWKAFENSIESLACHCAAKAKEGGYVAIALGYYGECHATKDQSKFDQLTHSPSSVSNKCVNHGFGECRDTDTKCIGQERATYVYDFPSQAPEEINGGYSEWSEYSTCSASCGEGEQIRERACINPVPQNGGDGCEALGSATESRPCKIKECPINGGYGAWTTYGACSKTCGSGLKQKTRKCDQPTPAHGGADCEGPASHSVQCNTQPCLGSTDCVYKVTEFDTDGGGEAIYLDRHSLHCPSGSVMNYMKLERNSDLNKIRYRYRCCKSQLACSDSLTTNSQTTNGGSNGNTVFFDRQTIQCNKKGISYLKLDRSGDNWNYKYDCCTVAYSKSSVTCYDLDTSFHDDGDGENIYLDRHTIKCNKDTDFVTYIKLVRNTGLDHIKYSYRCCSVDAPAVTN